MDSSPFIDQSPIFKPRVSLLVDTFFLCPHLGAKVGYCTIAELPEAPFKPARIIELRKIPGRPGRLDINPVWG